MSGPFNFILSENLYEDMLCQMHAKMYAKSNIFMFLSMYLGLRKLLQVNFLWIDITNYLLNIIKYL